MSCVAHLQSLRWVGGLITTAFQIGSALGLAICSIPQHAVSSRYQKTDTLSDKEIRLKSFAAGLWTSLALAGVALLLALVGMKRGILPNRTEPEVEPAGGEEKVAPMVV